MSQVAELIQECKAHLAEIEKDTERLVDADATQLRLAAKRLEMFVEHLGSLPAAEPAIGPTRRELNEQAVALGVESPDKLPNKAAVIDAIQVAQAQAAAEPDEGDGTGDDSSDDE